MGEPHAVSAPKCRHTVYLPVSLSILTWVTCVGLTGEEIVGLRGVPLTPLNRAENMLLDFFALSGLTSSEYRCGFPSLLLLVLLLVPGLVGEVSIALPRPM